MDNERAFLCERHNAVHLVPENIHEGCPWQKKV